MANLFRDTNINIIFYIFSQTYFGGIAKYVLKLSTKAQFRPWTTKPPIQSMNYVTPRVFA
jgi:hypothetical protein